MDLVDEVVHVHREPTPDGYRVVEQRTFDETLGVAGVPVCLSDVLAG